LWKNWELGMSASRLKAYIIRELDVTAKVLQIANINTDRVIKGNLAYPQKNIAPVTTT